MVVQIVGSWITGSLALAADAGHGLIDSLGLAIALVTAILIGRPPSDRRTWGFARAEVLSAGLQAGLLIALCLTISYEAIQRLIEPEPTQVIAGPMLWIGLIGLAANVAAMAILAGGRSDSLNMRAAFLEVTSDALGSVAVVAAAAITLATGWMYADSLASLLIAAMIGVRATMIMRTALRILLEQTPDGLELSEVRAVITSHPDVIAIHDLHASSIGSGLNTLTGHVVATQECVDRGDSVRLLHDLLENLSQEFPGQLNHVTLQIDNERHAAHEDLAH